MCLLTAKDVELRTAQIKKTNYGVYITLLVYKDARVDMRMLDKLYGPLGWQRHHREINGRLYCTISVYDKENKIWIEREDVGTPSNTEEVKGESSDSFKRAGFNFGIGRELYDAPNIRFKLNDGEYSDYNGKVSCYMKFRVSEMEYDAEAGEFSKFTVVDEKGNIRFANKKAVNVAQSAQNQPTQREKQQTNANAQAQQKNEPDVWVRAYKGQMCVYLPALKEWKYLATITNGAVLAMIATDAQGKYAQVKEQAKKMLEELKGAA